MGKRVPDKKCSVCGQMFSPRRADAVMCGSSCRSRARRVREGEISKKHAAALGAMATRPGSQVKRSKKR